MYNPASTIRPRLRKSRENRDPEYFSKENRALVLQAEILTFSPCRPVLFARGGRKTRENRHRCAVQGRFRVPQGQQFGQVIRPGRAGAVPASSADCKTWPPPVPACAESCIPAAMTAPRSAPCARWASGPRMEGNRPPQGFLLSGNIPAGGKRARAPVFPAETRPFAPGFRHFSPERRQVRLKKGPACRRQNGLARAESDGLRAAREMGAGLRTGMDCPTCRTAGW